jgi:hypothetical protein
LSTVALVASMFVATAGSVFTHAIHPECVANHHDCDKTTKISSCCCGDQDASRIDSTPVQARVEVRVDMTVTPALPNIVQVIATPTDFSPVQTSPPRLCLLDLPTLFVTFLI